MTCNRSRTRPPGSAAFGLIGLLIVMAIVLYLFFGNTGIGGAVNNAAGNNAGGGGAGGGGSGGTSYLGAVGGARRQGREVAFSINAHQLAILIAEYRQSNNGKLPQTWEDIEAPEASITDRWGNHLTFSFTEDPKQGGTLATFRSAGPDGQEGNEDDITSAAPLPY